MWLRESLREWKFFFLTAAVAAAVLEQQAMCLSEYLGSGLYAFPNIYSILSGRAKSV